VVEEVHFRVLNSWRFSCNVEFNPYSIVSLNYGHFFGLEDPSRVSEDLMEKKDLDKRVRALTTLTKDHEVADLATSYFDSKHPLPAVCFTFFIRLVFLLSLFAL
jgi:hypothetical protein